METLNSSSIAAKASETKSSVSMCFSYDLYRPLLFEAILPVIDAIEICPDTISYSKGGQVFLDERIIEQLQSVNAEKKIFIHGVGLSIGSYDTMNEQYLTLLDQLFQKLNITWHSEHLAYCRVNGENLNTMLSVPRTDEMLELLTKRVEFLKQRYAVPFLLENIANILPTQPYDYSLAEFLNKLQELSGCGFILDIYNLECDEHNYNFSLQDYLDALNLEAVKEIHIAGGTMEKGAKLDIHSRKVEDRTLQLTSDVLKKKTGVQVLTFELLPEAYMLYEPSELEFHLRHIKRTLEIA